MRPATLASAGRSLLVAAFLVTLAACDNAAAPVPEETPSTETAADLSAPAPIEPAPVPAAAEPVAAPRSQPATDRSPAAAAGKSLAAPVATPSPTPTATPVADPHAGHDMADEDMKTMGPN